MKLMIFICMRWRPWEMCKKASNIGYSFLSRTLTYPFMVTKTDVDWLASQQWCHYTLKYLQQDIIYTKWEYMGVTENIDTIHTSRNFLLQHTWREKDAESFVDSVTKTWIFCVPKLKYMQNEYVFVFRLWCCRQQYLILLQIKPIFFYVILNDKHMCVILHPRNTSMWSNKWL